MLQFFVLLHLYIPGKNIIDLDSLIAFISACVSFVDLLQLVMSEA